MVKKITKYAKLAVCCTLILSLIAPSYAALSASDGSAFVTKAEFDSALADFNARLTTFEAGINSKIDSQVSSYLDRNGIWNGQKQSFTSTNMLSSLLFQAGNNTSYFQYFQSFTDYYLLFFLYKYGFKSGTGNGTKAFRARKIINTMSKSGLMFMNFLLSSRETFGREGFSVVFPRMIWNAAQNNYTITGAAVPSFTLSLVFTQQNIGTTQANYNFTELARINMVQFQWDQVHAEGVSSYSAHAPSLNGYGIDKIDRYDNTLPMQEYEDTRLSIGELRELMYLNLNENWRFEDITGCNMLIGNMVNTSQWSQFFVSKGMELWYHWELGWVFPGARCREVWDESADIAIILGAGNHTAPKINASANIY